MLKSPTPQMFSSISKIQREMLTPGHEIWSQVLVCDLLTKEKENIVKGSYFPHQRADTTPLNPDEKKIIRFMPRRHPWWCVMSGTIDSICHYEFQKGWTYTFHPPPSLFGHRKAKLAFAFPFKTKQNKNPPKTTKVQQ